MNGVQIAPIEKRGRIRTQTSIFENIAEIHSYADALATNSIVEVKAGIIAIKTKAMDFTQIWMT